MSSSPYVSTARTHFRAPRTVSIFKRLVSGEIRTVSRGVLKPNIKYESVSMYRNSPVFGVFLHWFLLRCGMCIASIVLSTQSSRIIPVPLFSVLKSDMRFLFPSAFSVMVASRRVHNNFTILPTKQQSASQASLARTGMIFKKTLTARLFRVVFELTAFLLTIIVPVSVHAGVLDSILHTDAQASSSPEVVATSSVLDVPVLTPAQNPDPQSTSGGDEVVVDNGVLVSSGPIDKADIKAAHTDGGGEITIYTVRPGDSLSEIAAMFDVTANTILWANDLTKASAIRPGDNLIILPVAGVRHVVKSGDTIASIAKKYDGNAEEIISYNQLSSATDIAAGDTLVIPGGEVQTPVVVKKPVVAKPTKITGGTRGTQGGSLVADTSGTLVNPAPGTIETQGIHGYNGVDLGGPIGTTVRAAAGGQVIIAKASGYNGGYGSYIVIRHPNGTQTLYGHLSRVDVSVGENVAQAETIGAIGSTGRSTGPHLHFEVRGGKNPF